MRKKKIGILTFHFAHNYGAQLQAFALSQTIKHLGYDCQIIDYRLRYIYRWVEIYSIYTYYMAQREDGFTMIRSILRTIKHYPFLQQPKSPSWDNFEEFMKNYLPLTKRIYSWQLPHLHYDTYICGSDQIWNIELTGGYSTAYFLDFTNNCKKISYAASTGTNGFEFGHINEIKHALESFNYISCREKGLADTVMKITNKRANVVCDPIFLLKKNEWLKLISVKNRSAQKYLLIYSFNEGNDDIIAVSRTLAKKHNLKIKKISNNNIAGVEIIRDAGPMEFLQLFYSAQIIVTNTFHGVATSILLNKQFYVISPSKRRERIDNILNITNLSNRVITTADNVIQDDINYNDINPILNKIRLESIGFLKEALMNR